MSTKKVTKHSILMHNVQKLYNYIKRTARRNGISLRPGSSSSCAVGTIASGNDSTFLSGEVKNIKAIAKKAGLRANVLVQLENGFEGVAPGRKALTAATKKKSNTLRDGYERLQHSHSFTRGFKVQPKSAYYRLGLRLREEVLNGRP